MHDPGTQSQQKMVMECLQESVLEHMRCLQQMVLEHMRGLQLMVLERMKGLQLMVLEHMRELATDGPAKDGPSRDDVGLNFEVGWPPAPAPAPAPVSLEHYNSSSIVCLRSF